jgi:WD40 repeat protein
MTELPPRFTTDLEDSLNLRVPTDTMNDQHSTSSHSTRRRWDDPPEEEPTSPPENTTTMVFVKKGSMRPTYYIEAEIMHLTFTPSDAHIAAAIPKASNMRSFHPDGPFTMVVWSAKTGQRLNPPGPGSSGYGVRLGSGGFAIKPGVADIIVACPFVHPVAVTAETYGGMMPRLEVYDWGRRERLVKQDVAIRAPVAWSPDGEVLAGVSPREPSRIVVLQLAAKKVVGVRIGNVLMRHVDEVTQLAFLPAREEGGRALVSAGKDGYVRVTSVESGRTLKKIEIGTRAPASILRVSPDGKLVVTVWGRDVVLWYLDSGRVHNYNLDAVRQSEGWPLCVSPDCRYLACRTEEGFDVCDVATGKFRGEFAWMGNPITAAAFNSDGTMLAIGDYCGGLQMFEIVTP